MIKQTYITASQAIKEIGVAENKIFKDKEIQTIPFWIVNDVLKEFCKAKKHIELRDRFNSGDRKDYVKWYFIWLVEELKWLK